MIEELILLREMVAEQRRTNELIEKMFALQQEAIRYQRFVVARVESEALAAAGSERRASV
jgi:hypothetical protein